MPDQSKSGKRHPFSARAVISCPRDGQTIQNGYLAFGILQEFLSAPTPIQKIQYTFSKKDSMGTPHSENPVKSDPFTGVSWTDVTLSTGYTGLVSLSVVLLLDDAPSGDPDTISVTIGDTSDPCS
jgi:hypothetical protein